MVKEEGNLDNQQLANQVTILYIYMPIIQQQTVEFNKLWNIHKIHKQRDKANLLTEKPWLNYYSSPDGIMDYGVAIDV